MKSEYSSKERLLATIKGEIPDRVPIQLGITNMFSVNFCGSSAFDVFVDGKVPYWKVVVDTTRHFGLDGYLYMGLDEKSHNVEVSVKTLERSKEKIVQRTEIQTQKKLLFNERTIMADETPSTTVGFIKDREDFEIWLEYCFPDEYSGKEEIFRAKEYLGHDGVVAGIVGIPGLASLSGLFDGKLERATFFCYDYPELVDEFVRKSIECTMKRIDCLLDAKVDYIQLGSSGMLTLSTPELFRVQCLPAMKQICQKCNEAGVLTELHCCGKERMVVEDCYNETLLDSINPLQPPPMGDCDLKEIKEKFGDKLCLKGNVGVTFPLWQGTPDDVEKDVIHCLEAAKEGGRYILFSEEGIGANTPYENVERFVQAGLEYGKY